VNELTKNLEKLVNDQAEDKKYNTDDLLGLLNDNYMAALEHSSIPPLTHVNALMAFSSINREFVRYDEAEMLLKKARDVLIENPQKGIIYTTAFAEMQYLTAELLIRTGRYTEAQGFLERAVKDLSVKKSVDILYNQKLNLKRARLFLNMGQYNEAQTVAREIIDSIEFLPHSEEKNTLMSDAIMCVAIGLRNLGDLAGAQAELKALLSSNIAMYGELNEQNTSVFQSLAAIYAAKGNYDDALKHYRAAEKYYEKNSDQYSLKKALLLHNLSYVVFELGQVGGALNAIDNAIEIYDFHFGGKSPNHAFLYSTKASHYFNIGDIPEAKIHNAVAIELFEHPDQKHHIFRSRALQLEAHIYRLEGDIMLCANLMQTVSKMLADQIPDESHWMRKVAEVSTISCEMPLESVLNFKTMPSNSPISTIISELESTFGVDGMPLRQIKHLIGQR
jgi:tetratricopeptide (TPR) repeat protein